MKSGENVAIFKPLCDLLEGDPTLLHRRLRS
jgi:hypothetical protein